MWGTLRFNMCNTNPLLLVGGKGWFGYGEGAKYLFLLSSFQGSDSLSFGRRFRSFVRAGPMMISVMQEVHRKQVIVFTGTEHTFTGRTV